MMENVLNLAVELLKATNSKMDMLTGEVQSLKQEIKEKGLQVSKTSYVSTKELANYAGCSDKTILKWINEERFPASCLFKRKRGSYFVYKFKTIPAQNIVDKLIANG